MCVCACVRVCGAGGAVVATPKPPTFFTTNLLTFFYFFVHTRVSGQTVGKFAEWQPWPKCKGDARKNPLEQPPSPPHTHIHTPQPLPLLHNPPTPCSARERINDTDVRYTISNMYTTVKKIGDLLRVATWCCDSYLLIYPDKTKFVLMGTRLMSRLSVVLCTKLKSQKLQPDILDPELSFNIILRPRQL